jgi:hypothetical protein
LIKILKIQRRRFTTFSRSNIKVEIVSRLYYFADIVWKIQIQTLLVREEAMEVAEAIVVADMEAAADMEAVDMEEDGVAALEVQDRFDQHQSKSGTNSMLKSNQ